VAIGKSIHGDMAPHAAQYIAAIRLLVHGSLDEIRQQVSHAGFGGIFRKIEVSQKIHKRTI